MKKSRGNSLVRVQASTIILSYIIISNDKEIPIMVSLMQELTAKVSEAVTKVAGEIQLKSAVLVPAQNTKFGDYQCNVSMELSKRLGAASGEKVNPRQVAEQIVAELDVSALCELPTIAGPGFINFALKSDVLTDYVVSQLKDERLGINKAEKKKRVVVDFSGPNLAKEMHVGHLRSTIIGDSISRFMEFEGHEVLRMNHVGDWGT